MAGRVGGKRALITGGAGGLGEAIARMLAREGARVAVSDIDLDGAQRTARRIEEDGFGPAFAYRHDVTDEAAWIDVAARADADLGGISVLVNNAGVGCMSPVEKQDLKQWRWVMAVDLDSVMLGTKHVLPILKRSQPAAIVNISSIAGLAAHPDLGAYNAAKAGVWLFSKSVALECARDGFDVRCNSVHPAFIKTPILDPFVAMAGGDEDAALQKLARGIPLKRVGEPDDVAYAVLYLASDESRFITGTELKVDGGLTAQ
jgi:NAD(P)-dependent dehydrogenase (short-subunit alcohol dehydrogenase family)